MNGAHLQSTISQYAITWKGVVKLPASPQSALRDQLFLPRVRKVAGGLAYESHIACRCFVGHAHARSKSQNKSPAMTFVTAKSDIQHPCSVKNTRFTPQRAKLGAVVNAFAYCDYTMPTHSHIGTISSSWTTLISFSAHHSDVALLL